MWMCFVYRKYVLYSEYGSKQQAYNASTLSIKHFRSIGVVPMTVLPLCVSHSDYCVGIDDVPMKKKHNNTHFPINTCFYCYAYLSSLVVNKWTDSFNFNQKLNGEFTFRCSFAWNMCIRFIIDNTFHHFNVFAN